MKKLFSLGVFAILAIMFMSNNSYAQNNPDIGKIFKYQFHKLFDLKGDGQGDCDEALKIKERKRLHDGSGECNGFIDDDGDGVCDNCGGTGDCDRTRDRKKDGNGFKKRGGN